MERSFQIDPIEGGGWRLRLFEDGEDAGGGRGDDADYEYLLDAGQQFVGVDESSSRPGFE